MSPDHLRLLDDAMHDVSAKTGFEYQLIEHQDRAAVIQVSTADSDASAAVSARIRVPHDLVTLLHDNAGGKARTKLADQILSLTMYARGE